MVCGRNRRRVSVLIAALALMYAGRVTAAVFEFDMRQAIGNSVAVMRFLHRERCEAEDRIKMVEYSIAVHRAQLDTQKGLIEREAKSGESANVQKVRIAHYTKTLRTLELHMKYVTQVDLVSLYRKRIADLTKQLAEQQILLEAKMIEYRVHFGMDAPVDLEYQEKENRLRPRVEQPGALIVR